MLNKRNSATPDQLSCELIDFRTSQIFTWVGNHRTKSDRMDPMSLTNKLAGLQLAFRYLKAK